MFERRPIFGLFIGLMICISIWRISIQEPAILSGQMNINTKKQYQSFQQPPYHIITSAFQSTDDANYNHISKSILNNLNSNKLSINNELEKHKENDFNKLIDLNNFKYIINQSPCTKLTNIYNDIDGKIRNFISIPSSEKFQALPSPLILILVHSSPQNVQKRKLIRETWGSFDTFNLRLIFLLGSVFTQKQQSIIESENEIYSDIVQGNFIDNYRNMTYKHVMAFKWFIYYCPNAKYLLKTDDDIFVNTPYLIEFIKKEYLSNPNTINNNTISSNQHYNENILPKNNFLYCLQRNRIRVGRSFRSKWRVSVKEYPDRFYPSYCPGFSLLYSPDSVFKLYKLAQKSKYFWIDDVHITGVLAQLANITIINSEKTILHKDDYNFNKDLIEFKDLNHMPISSNNSPETLTDIYDKLYNYIFLFTLDNLNEKQIRFLWRFVQKDENGSMRKVKRERNIFDFLLH